MATSYPAMLPSEYRDVFGKLSKVASNSSITIVYNEQTRTFTLLGSSAIERTAIDRIFGASYGCLWRPELLASPAGGGDLQFKLCSLQERLQTHLTELQSTWAPLHAGVSVKNPSLAQKVNDFFFHFKGIKGGAASNTHDPGELHIEWLNVQLAMIRSLQKIKELEPLEAVFPRTGLLIGEAVICNKSAAVAV